MGHGVAGQLPQFPCVVGFSVTERYGDAGSVQDGRMVETGAQLIEVAGQIVERVDQYRHTRFRQAVGNHPGFGPAADDRLQPVPAREFERLQDVAGTVHFEHGDAAGTEMVHGLAARQGQERGRGPLQIRSGLYGGFSHGLFQQHPLPGARTGALLAGVGADVQEQDGGTQKRGIAVVESDRSTLATDDTARPAGTEHGPGVALDPGDRDN